MRSLSLSRTHPRRSHVLFVLPEHAVAALAGADGRVFQGRLLHVLPARPVPAEHARRKEAAAAAAIDAAAGGPKQSQYQRATDEAKRAGAGSAHEAASVWNALFLRADTTVAAMAEQLGVGRGELLLGDDAAGGEGGKGGKGGASGGMAVRLALAETELIAQARRRGRGQGGWRGVPTSPSSPPFSDAPILRRRGRGPGRARGSPRRAAARSSRAGPPGRLCGRGTRSCRPAAPYHLRRRSRPLRPRHHR